jgi:hypothetical protein
LSGSPVFVQIGTSRVVQGTLTFSVGEHGGYGSIFLLGMINGHFGETDPNAILYGEAKSVNMGIGIVVPAKDILSTFEHPALLAYRNAELRKPQEEKKQTLPEDD